MRCLRRRVYQALSRGRTAGRAALLLTIFTMLPACDAGKPGAAESPKFLAAAQLESHSDADLYRFLREAETQFSELSQSSEGVRTARYAARIAMVLATRGVPAESVSAARDMLEQVLEGAGLPGLCDAGVDLAILERDVHKDEEASSSAAGAVVKRFGPSAGEQLCLSRLSSLAAGGSGLLAGYGPSPVTLDGTPPRKLSTLQRVEVFGSASFGQRQVRVVLYFDGVVPYRRSESLAEGKLSRRALLDLEGAVMAPDVSSVVPVGRGGLRELRLFALPDGRLRVTYNLAEQADYRMFFLSHPYRVVFDAALRGVSERVAGRRRVVLDPGHGGHNPGAKGPTGLRESDVALSLARRVRRVLEREDSHIDVLLTRDADVEVTLEERAAIANANDADVFVSIHLNASGSQTDKGGVSTFVLDTTDDRQALSLAARENDTVVEEVGALEKVLASLYRREQTDHSLTLARSIHRRTLHHGREALPNLADRGVKRALFYVLVGVTMPAVLIEASFITRPEEEKALGSDAYREALAGGISRGILDYLADSKR